MVDPDGDNVRCRWAIGDECHSICNGVPVASLDEVLNYIRYASFYKDY